MMEDKNVLALLLNLGTPHTEAIPPLLAWREDAAARGVARL